MTAKTAKLFVNGGSQAVRLPAEFRFDAVEEVYIRRDTTTGDLILSEKPISTAWDAFFALRDSTDVPTDFLSDRPLNDALSPRAFIEDH